MSAATGVAVSLLDGFRQSRAALATPCFLRCHVGSSATSATEVGDVCRTFLVVGEELLAARASRINIVCDGLGAGSWALSVEFGPGASGLLLLSRQEGPAALREMLLLGTRGSAESVGMVEPWPSAGPDDARPGLVEAIGDAQRDGWASWSEGESA